MKHIKGKTMNTREAYQALLNGETLVSAEDTIWEYKIDDKGLYREKPYCYQSNVVLPPAYSLSIKPKTININGFKVPEPVRDASDCHESLIYYIPSLTNSNGVLHCNWISSEEDYKFLNAGLVHLTEENAAKHAEALLSFTKKYQ